jgi:hypothetical protein
VRGGGRPKGAGGGGLVNDDDDAINTGRPLSSASDSFFSARGVSRGSVVATMTASVCCTPSTELTRAEVDAPGGSENGLAI